MSSVLGQDVYSQRLTDKHLERESRQEQQKERFNNMCLGLVKDYMASGSGEHTASDLAWESVSEGFNSKRLGSAGQDVLLMQAIKKELEGDKESAKQFINEFANATVQGAINYLIGMASYDVSENLNIEHDSITPDQYIIEE